MTEPSALLIAGPTGSGKSALALALAEEIGGVVVNADSMQVYRDLRIITARPTPQEEARAPHRLYGHVDAAETYSAGRWVSEVAPVLADLRAQPTLPILVGGTGLYFRLLTRGLASIPPIPEALRARIRDRLSAQGAAALHAELSARDPPAAERLNPADGSRVARALEIVEATGRSILDWQREERPGLVDPRRALCVFLSPDRAALAALIEARFETMLAQGALDEVRALAERGLDPRLPAMKAHGVPWLIRHLNGELSLEEAAFQAKRDTRLYAKRQFTWARNQLPGWAWMTPDGARAGILRAFGR